MKDMIYVMSHFKTRIIQRGKIVKKTKLNFPNAAMDTTKSAATDGQNG